MTVRCSLIDISLQANKIVLFPTGKARGFLVPPPDCEKGGEVISKTTIFKLETWSVYLRDKNAYLTESKNIFEDKARKRNVIVNSFDFYANFINH